jgi:MoaA/NifB/PqqE/SkfB family radical SAM enzyme
MKIQDRILKKRYPNFYWAVTWAITNVCNLKCSYCIVPPAKKHPDLEVAIRTLIEMKPKHLCINGGEPTLVPDVVGVLKRLRAGIDPRMQIEFNTNGTLPDRVFEILPHINNLCFSIDGVGEVNTWQRGYDGDRLLDFLDELVQYQPAPEQKFRILVVPVATQLGYTRIPELIERVEKAWKKGRVPVSMEIKPVHPYDHPMTLANKPDFWKDFIARSAEWTKRYELPVIVRGVSSGSGCDVDAGARIKSLCLRQFFSAWVTCEGRRDECKPVKYYECFQRDYLAGGWREKAKTICRALDTLYFRPYNQTCYTPCDHAEFLDGILSSGSAREMAEKIEKAGLHVPADELGKACRFLKSHYMPNLVIDPG